MNGPVVSQWNFINKNWPVAHSLPTPAIIRKKGKE